MSTGEPAAGDVVGTSCWWEGGIGLGAAARAGMNLCSVCACFFSNTGIIIIIAVSHGLISIPSLPHEGQLRHHVCTWGDGGRHPACGISVRSSSVPPLLMHAYHRVDSHPYHSDHGDWLRYVGMCAKHAREQAACARASMHGGEAARGLI